MARPAPTSRAWGAYDGSGEMSSRDYRERFVFDRDYLAVTQGPRNKRIGEGNSLNNVREVFGENAVFQDYFVPGSENYAGMDWRTLRLVFVRQQDTWWLAAIVHDEWPI